MGAVAGALIATQIRINASLGEQIGSVLVASLFTFVSGLAVLLVLLAFRPTARAGLVRLREACLPPWMYVTGVIAAAQVATFTWVAPTIGTAMFAVAAVTGQMIGGMVVDAIGIGGRPRQRPSLPRLNGALLAIAAICVTQIGKPLGEIAVGLIAICLGVNLFVALHLGLIGVLNRRSGDPIATTTVHFTVAMASLGIVVGIVAGTGGLSVGTWPSHPWLYLGGACGVALIALVSVTARRLDVLRVALVVNGGQLLGALLLDAVVPGGTGVTVWLAAGAALTIAAVGVAGRTARVPRDWTHSARELGNRARRRVRIRPLPGGRGAGLRTGAPGRYTPRYDSSSRGEGPGRDPGADPRAAGNRARRRDRLRGGGRGRATPAASRAP